MCGWLGKLKDRIRRTCRLLSPKVLSLSTWSADVNIYTLSTSQLSWYYQNTFIFLMFYLLVCCSVTQSCLTLCNPMDCSMPGFTDFHYQSSLKLMFNELVIPSNHLTFCHPFSSCSQSFPSSGSFPVSWLFASRGQSIGASAAASVLPVNIQGWFPLRLTGLISF